MEIPRVSVTSVRETGDETDPSVHGLAEAQGEQTLLKIHPVVFRRRPLGTLCILIVWGAAGYLFVRSLGADEGNSFGWIALAAVVASLLVVAYWYILSVATTLTITDNRTIFREGIISRDTSEVQHDDVRNIQIEQTFSQRLVGVGDIGISSSGQDDLEIVAVAMPDPAGAVDLIRENQE
ncbi:PH domain-containing protein [Allorhodopirellula solitaria]|nr:PH domain-containing protein [Allorhodopirellula solitaria]